jgi:hypothetical protein
VRDIGDETVRNVGSTDPEWKCVPVRRFAASTDDLQGDYGGPDSCGGPDSYDEPDTLGADGQPDTNLR